MTRALVAAGMLVWLGATLLLSNWRRVQRVPLSARLAPFSPAAVAAGGGARPQASLRELVAAGAEAVGARLARVFGVEEPAGLRLRRIHSPMSVAAFRTRQLAWAAAGLGVGLVAAAAGAPAPLALLVMVGAPLLAFLVVEQRLASASARWQSRLGRELPVVAEQLAMLLNAGFSLGASLNRLAGRGEGCCARDLRQVANRVRQGLSETAALAEWAEVARVDALDRLVALLALEAEAADLGRLVSAEARQVRRDLHRQMTELVERRSQQVWIPVSVASLVPGVILIAVPFLAALRLFANA